MAAAPHPGAVTADRPATVAVDAAPPRASWFTHVVWLLLLAELAWAVSAVTIAMLGVFSYPLVVIATIGITAGLWIATRGARRSADRTDARAVTWVRVAALGIALLAAVGNGALPGEHLQTGRDGGTYTATAGWLVSDGDLIIDAARPPFDNTEGLGYFAAGFHEIVPDGPLYAQFMHAFPAMMATVADVAGLDAMVRTNAVLGGLALLLVFAFAERVVRPLPALLVQIALAVNLVFVYFTRAPFSELLTMAMVFGGLWALDHAVGRRDRTLGYVAGLVLGGTFLARLDGLVVLLMLLIALLPPVVTPRVRRVAPLVLAGMATTTGIAIVDLFVFAPFYVDLHVAFLVPLAAGFLVVAAFAALASTGPGRRLTAQVVAHRRAIATGLAVLIVVAAAFAYVVRPSLPAVTWDRTTPIGFLQQQEGEPVNEARTYAEQTMRWLAWYLGLPALAAGVVGWALLTRDVVARRVGRLVPFLLTFSGLAVLYVWRPSITPDHIWADRRFLPVVLPGLLLCGAWLLDRLWQRSSGASWRVGARVLIAGLAVAIIALPLRTTWPAADLREQAGLAGDVARACERLGDDAALLLLDEAGTAMHYRMTQPLRAHCGVPAAWADESISDERIVELAERAGDRTLYVLAEERRSFAGRPTGEPFTLLEHRSSRLEATLTAPPRARDGYGLDVLAAPVLAPSGR